MKNENSPQTPFVEDIRKIKTYTKEREITPQEGAELLVNAAGGVVEGCKFWDDPKLSRSGKLVCVVLNSLRCSFCAVCDSRMGFNGISQWKHCAIAEETHPRDVPEGVPPLPGDKPWLAYVPSEDVISSGRQNPVYHSTFGKDGEVWHSGQWGGYPDHNYYAIDVRTDFAKENFPDIVECYRDCSFMQPEPDPEIAPGHNPDKLTVEQVEVSEGWRLLSKEEQQFAQNPEKGLTQLWGFLGGWEDVRQRGKFYQNTTYRTLQPEGYFLRGIASGQYKDSSHSSGEVQKLRGKLNTATNARDNLELHYNKRCEQVKRLFKRLRSVREERDRAIREIKSLRAQLKTARYTPQHHQIKALRDEVADLADRCERYKQGFNDAIKERNDARKHRDRAYRERDAKHGELQAARSENERLQKEVKHLHAEVAYLRSNSPEKRLQCERAKVAGLRARAEDKEQELSEKQRAFNQMVQQYVDRDAQVESIRIASRWKFLKAFLFGPKVFKE